MATDGDGTARDNVLEVDALRRTFGGLVAVNDVDFTIPERSIVSLIGPNGAGKTTFFNILTGLYQPTSGGVRFKTRDGEVRSTRRPAAAPHRTARHGAHVPEHPPVRQHDRAGERDGRHAPAPQGRAVARRSCARRGLRREEKDARERAAALLQFVGLGRRVYTASRNLPYGDQRRLEVARALALEPTLLLLDEPTAGMNPQESHRFTEFVRQLRDERGLTVLLIEHDMQVVMGVSERVTVLDYGDEDRRGPARRDPQATRA